MNFTEVREKINEFDSKGELIPHDIHEFFVCEIFAKHLSAKSSNTYDDVTKDLSLELLGVDVTLTSNQGNSILLQLVHAKDYSMNPRDKNKAVDTSGLPIIEAARDKCKKYSKKGIDTSNIILLIDGANVGSKINDLSHNLGFLRQFQIITCFKEIYYIHNYNGGRVYPLKTI